MARGGPGDARLPARNPRRLQRRFPRGRAMSTYESPEERRQRAGIIEVPLPGKSAKKLNGGSHPQPDAFPKNDKCALKGTTKTSEIDPFVGFVGDPPRRIWATPRPLPT